MYSFISMLLCIKFHFHIEELNRGISGNYSIGWCKKTSRDKRELVWLLHRETVLCQFCYKKQWLRNRSLTITYGSKPGQCMFNVQEWECTAVQAHISLSLQDCWKTAGDCWERTARFVVSCVNQMPSYPWVSWVSVEMADAALQLDYQSLSSMHQWCVSQTGRKKHFINFTGIDRFSTGLAGQSACHLAVCHSPS